MPRVIDTDVQGILEVDASKDLTQFILTANTLVNKVLGSSDLTEAHLKVIELWLAAHFVCIMDPREQEVEADRATAIFEGKAGMGLDRTRYGQQVKLLDTTGAFAELELDTASPRRQAYVTVAPREEEAEEDEE